MKTIKQRISYAVMGLMAMGFTACTQNEDMAPTLKGQEINATFSVGGMQTRVNTLGYGDNWEDKDKLTVSIFTDSDPGSTTVLSFNGETWSRSGSFRWLNEYEQHTILAVYPSDTDFGKNNLQYDLQTDQSSEGNLKNADLITGYWYDAPRFDLNIPMRHRMSLVTITYHVGTADYPNLDIEELQVYPKSTKVTFEIDQVKKEITMNQPGGNPNSDWITACKHDNNQFSAIVIPDSYAADDTFLKFKLGNQSFNVKKIAAERLFEIFDRQQEDDDQYKVPFLRSSCGDVIFHDITFRYGSREIIFEHFNICFPSGKVSAIVGESGSGKSTIVSLIQNLYPLLSGKITIGGIDIKHISTNDLRSAVIAVPQRIDLFNGSVADNILLDDLEPDWEHVNDLCRRLGIREFVDKLPQGLKTYIGENGMQLSGGQRQRIAIARALYRNPEILILDEATSALDSEAEQMIKNIINDLRKNNRTVILIAHRLSTIMNADKIFLLKDGKLVEQGSHEELINANGKYFKMWEIQTGNI